MKTKLRSVALIVTCTLWQSALPGMRVVAQHSPPPESQKKQPSVSADKELQKRVREQQVTRILSVLSATADNAKHWTDAAAASKVQAQISDVIWDADSEIARGYLIRAWDTTARVEISKRERSPFRNQSPRTDARREVILVARKRAPDLSKKWLQQMAQESEQDKHDRGTFDDRTARSTLLLQMALQIVSEDPEAAASLATDSLQEFGFLRARITVGSYENKDNPPAFQLRLVNALVGLVNEFCRWKGVL